MKALFLDIDGVLQPIGSQERFDHLLELPALLPKLQERISNGFDLYENCCEESWRPGYEYDRFKVFAYDVAAVLWDWEPEAVTLLHQVLEETGAGIVLSSDWRDKGFDECQALPDLQGLGKYFYGMIYCDPMNPDYGAYYPFEEQMEMHEQWDDCRAALWDGLSRIFPEIKREGLSRPARLDLRTVEILEYLDRHSEITAYAAVDDRFLKVGLGAHFVHSNDRHLTPSQAQQLKEALASEDGPYFLPLELKTREFSDWRARCVDHCKYRM